MRRTRHGVRDPLKRSSRSDAPPTEFATHEQSWSWLTRLSIDLDYLGVDPQHQRRGIGRKLLTAGLEMAADTAAKQGDGAFNCYLVATPAGQALYESVGFKAINELTMSGCVHRSMMLRSQGKSERN